MVSDKLLRQYVEDEKRRRGIEPSLPAKSSALGSAIASASQTADDAARAFANTLTFGQTDRFVKALPEWLGGEPDAYERTAAARQRSPNVSRAADIAGYSIPMGAIPRAIGRVAPAMAGTIPGAIGSLGLEGGILSSAHQLGEKGTWDPTETATGAGLNILGGIHPFARASTLRSGTSPMTVLDEELPKPTQIVNRAGKEGRASTQTVNRTKKEGRMPSRKRRGPLPEVELPQVAGWPY